MVRKIIRLPEVCLRTGLSRSTIYENIALGCFPKPIRIGKRAVGWIESEIDAHIEAQIQASRKNSNPPSEAV